MKKIISFILILSTLLGCLAVLPFGAWAAALTGGSVIETLAPVKPSSVVSAYTSGATKGEQGQKYDSAQDKLDRDDNMVHMVTKGNKELYANVYTGEVYVKDTATGNILYTNPYDITGATETTGPKYMSQVILKYVMADTNKGGTTLYSFTDSAMHGQITIDSIVDGVRVNYALGETTKRYNIPYGIMANDLIEKLYAPMQKDIEEELKEIAVAAGVPEKYQSKYFDFVSFCSGRDGKQYSTEKLLGVEYTYGNIDAFDAWFTAALNFYEAFYTFEDYELREQNDDPHVARDPDWQEGKPTKSEVKSIATDYDKLCVYFVFETPYLDTTGDDPANWKTSPTTLARREILNVMGTHPTLGKEYLCNAIFTADQTLLSNKMREFESLFNRYVPGYTLAMATASEEETKVFPLKSENPVFYISIEYKLTAEGVVTEIPATSVMYDESLYKVNYIEILPYMGSADVSRDGYVFFPDGSGTLIDFAEFRGSTETTTVDGKVYGEDYAKYVIEGMYQKNISMPVFGTVRDDSSYAINTPFGTFPCSFKQYSEKNFAITYTEDKGTYYAHLPYGRTVQTTQAYVLNESTGYYEAKEFSTVTTDANYYANITTQIRAKDYVVTSTSDTGYFAMVEEGAALTSLYMEFNGQKDRMSRMSIRFTPRVEDVYTLENEKSGDLTFVVQAKNKYKGSFTVRYVMLTDKKIADAAGVSDYYQPTYAGMAQAYQEYLVENGLLPASADVKDQLPLIIENFGVMQTKKKFLSIPFTVDVALTTFENVETMYEELTERGIENVKFRLTGFANGGMYSTYPVKLKWEGKAGGKGDFKDLLAYAQTAENQEAGLQIFPNFDFMYISRTDTGDGISLKKIGARSADNRYAIRKAYTSIYQAYTFNTSDGILVNSAKLEELYAKFSKKYTKYGNSALSVKGMASDLSGNFDEDNGLTREESLNYITDMLDAVVASSSNMSLMSDGGNLYALKYMSYLVKAPLDSSRFKFSSRAVPFWGMVVHGHVQYTGEAFNEQANKDEALLRAIESGANLYFILSYANTQLMKDDLGLSKYYSVDYQISKATVEEYYKKLNAAIGDLQSYHLVGHDLLFAERVGIEEDLEAQIAELEEEFMRNFKTLVSSERDAIRRMIVELRNYKIDATALLATHDTDKDGQLSLSEVESAWNLFGKNNRDNFLLTTRKYYTTPAVADIIDHADLDIEDSDLRDAETLIAAKKLYAAIINGEMKLDFGQTIGIVFNEEAVIASARELFDVDSLRDEFVAELRAYMAEVDVGVNGADIVTQISTVSYVPAHSYFTTSSALDEDYKATESTVSNGTVVMVTYSNGTDVVRLVLNYNIFDVNLKIDGVGTVSLEKYGYVRID